VNALPRVDIAVDWKADFWWIVGLIILLSTLISASGAKLSYAMPEQ